MGLEGVEIIIEIENEFKIDIPDKDIKRILTVGGLAQYVQHRLTGKTIAVAEIPCTTMRAFHMLRRTMMNAFGIDRAAIRPQAKLRSLLPYSIRSEFWHALESAGLHAPPLVVSQAVQFAVIACSGLVGSIFLVGMLKYGWHPAIFALWIPVACISAVYVLRRSNICLPASCVTVGDLARQTYLVNCNDGKEWARALPDHDVMNRVKTIVADNLAIPKQSLRADTRFADLLP